MGEGGGRDSSQLHVQPEASYKRVSTVAWML